MFRARATQLWEPHCVLSLLSGCGQQVTRRRGLCLCWCFGSAILLLVGLKAENRRSVSPLTGRWELTWFPPLSWFMLGLGAAAAWNGFGCSAKGFLAGGPAVFLLSTRLSRLTRAECSPSRFSTALLGLAPLFWKRNVGQWWLEGAPLRPGRCSVRGEGEGPDRPCPKGLPARGLLLPRSLHCCWRVHLQMQPWRHAGHQSHQQERRGPL